MDSSHPASAAPAAADAQAAVAQLREMSADLRACAVLDSDGGEVARDGGGGWPRAGDALLAAADAAGPRPVTQVHVATEDGEAFAVREGGLTMLAVTERFTLASLVLFDMRSILRDLASGGGVRDRRAPLPSGEGAR